jgi:hypothetical protein
MQPTRKAKVYHTAVSNHVRFGEVLGVTSDHKLILEERPEFATLPVSAFDYFREAKEVVFLSELDSGLYERQWKKL